MLVLTEQDVKQVLDMKTAIEAVEQAMRDWGTRKASNHPRRRHPVPCGLFHIMDAALPAAGFMGLKSYTSARDGSNQFHVLLYSAETGRLEALIEAETLGAIRTGAATAVAARYAARKDSATLGLIGAGRQAATQLEALCAVFPIRHVAVYSRTPEKLARFCREQSGRLGVPVEPAPNVESTVRDKDLVVTATSSREPFLCGRWLAPGCHLTAMGANHLLRRELCEDVFQRTARVIVDDVEQARLESGEITAAVRAGLISWDQLVPLASVVAGAAPGRERPDEITLFKSHGIALWDIAVAAPVFRAARERGLGRETA